jgi:hypothetical protein
VRRRNFTSLSFDQLLALLHEARQLDPELTEIANKLVPEAGQYLPATAINLLVRDEISESDVRREVRRQKDFLARLGNHLPELLEYLKKSDHRIERVIDRIDCCFHDFPVKMSAPRRDRALRLAISEIKKAQQTLLDATAAMSALDRTVAADIEDFLNSYLQASSSYQKFDGFFTKSNDFLEQLKLRSQILDICLFRAQSDDGYLSLSDNQTKTHIVKTAYELCLWNGGPPLVTTPNSDFQQVCILLYEIVSGKPTDEGLAGAINRFARSNWRRERDQNEIELQRQSVSDDNFLQTKDVVQRAEDEMRVYAELLREGKQQLGEEQKIFVLAALKKAEARKLSALNAYGPHNVYELFQDPRTVAFFGKLAEEHELEKKASIALGEARRRQRLVLT